VRLKFSDLLTTEKFRLYTLPCRFDDIAQRKRLDSDDAYSDAVSALLSVNGSPPLIYLWNIQPESDLSRSNCRSL
jgi:hypothetical protein